MENRGYYEYTKLLSYPIIRASTCIKRKIHAEFLAQGYDITFEQWMLLTTLYNTPGLIQAEIAECTAKDRTNVTRILDVLSKSSYLERRAKPGDRRCFCIYLTETCKQVTESLIPIVQEVNRNIQEELSQIQIEILKQALNTIYECLENGTEKNISEE